MANVELVLGEATFAVASQTLGQTCGLFTAGSPPSRYRVQSRISLGLFRSFLEAVTGSDVQITSENFSGLSHLCEEFGFRSLSTKLSAFRDSPAFKDAADAEARGRISALEERDSQQERRLAALEAKQLQLAADLARVASEVRASAEAAQRQLCGEVERLQSEVSGLQALAAERARDVEAMRQKAKADAAALRAEVGLLAAEVEQLEASSGEVGEVKAKQTEQEQQIADLRADFQNQLQGGFEEVKAKQTEQEKHIAALKA
jgi:chromosome segregation ATPase